jgi:hypothetical protein
MQTSKVEQRATAREQSGYVVDVLRCDGELVASFMCPVEAFRFAALIHEPGRAPVLRRRPDGAMEYFSAGSTAAKLVNWVAESPIARDRWGDSSPAR